KIERDINAFKNTVAELIASVAPQLADKQSEEAVLELERLLHVATRAQELAADRDAKIAAQLEKVTESDQSAREAQAAIARQQEATFSTSVDELREAIRRSDELRFLQFNLEAVADALAQDGDGLTVAELTTECADVDLDQIAAREQTINQELADLRTR